MNQEEYRVSGKKFKRSWVRIFTTVTAIAFDSSAVTASGNLKRGTSWHAKSNTGHCRHAQRNVEERAQLEEGELE